MKTAKTLAAITVMAAAALAAGCAGTTGLEARAGGRLRVVTEDRDRDGRPDRWLHYRGREVVVKESDLNYDGKPDTRLEFSTVTGRSGRAVLEVRESRDTDHDGRTDTWKVIRDGVLVSKRLDKSGNGQVDYEQRYSASGRLRGVAYDRSGDGRMDIARQLGPRGETVAIRYDEDHDGAFDTTANMSGGKLTSLESGGRELSPGHLYHTRGLRGKLVGFFKDRAGKVHVRVKLVNSGAEAVKLPSRPTQVDFRMTDPRGRRVTLAAEVPKARGKAVEIGAGSERTVTFPVDLKLPEGTLRVRATVHYSWNEELPLGWVGRTVTDEIGFDGRVGRIE